MSPTWEIRQGDALERLRAMPDESVHCCVTSPPYYGLRDYGTAQWEGGDPACGHLSPTKFAGTARSTLGDERYGNGLTQERIEAYVTARQQQYRARCRACGAIRVDQQIGLEASLDEYIERLIVLFREVRRVLKADGSLWLNLGDTYAARAQGNSQMMGSHDRGVGRADRPRPQSRLAGGFKNKDLMMVPAAVAMALRADGWWLRADVIWAKPAPMPESITDRPTRSHEHVFLLTKSARYYYDAAAIREPDSGQDHARRVLDGQPSLDPSGGVMPAHSGLRTAGGRDGLGRNKRDVWTIAARPFPDAHFAVMPTALAEPCIRAGCPEGGTVLDPFSGAGTTGLVALRHNRSYVGLELNPEFCELSRRRIRDDAPLLNGASEIEQGAECPTFDREEAAHGG